MFSYLKSTFIASVIWILHSCHVLSVYMCIVSVLQVYASKRFRAGKGKMRNRRRIQRRGPLIIYNNDQGITRAFRNIPGKILPIFFLYTVFMEEAGSSCTNSVEWHFWSEMVLRLRVHATRLFICWCRSWRMKGWGLSSILFTSSTNVLC